MDTRSEHRANSQPTQTWGRAARVFHWLNFVCVLALMVLGLAILNAKAFGVSVEGKVLLKTLHVYVGYVFVINLGWRIIWAFIGHENARWNAMLPFYRGYVEDLKRFLRDLRASRPTTETAHNPLGRLMVTFLLLLMLTQAGTGLVLAGTDLYMPPFGNAIADWVTDGDAELRAKLQPGSTDYVVESSYSEMRAFRKPYISVHEFVFYIMAAAVLLHIVGVVVGEFKERNGLVSAMITGRRSGNDGEN